MFNTSKIQNESNSQLVSAKQIIKVHCVQYVKDTKWKQFTTMPVMRGSAGTTVFNTSKIQNESNSQLKSWFDILNRYCVQYVKDTKWKQFTTIKDWLIPGTILCSIRQRYKMKAIHNLPTVIPFWNSTVFNTSKIQNESNSQLHS